MSCMRWPSALQWFAVTQGSSIWLAISGAVLLARGHGLPGWVFLAAYALTTGVALIAWIRQSTWPPGMAWQTWLLATGVLGLIAVVTVHRTGAHGAINLGAASLWGLYVSLVIGVPLLIADCRSREKSNGARGVFGAIFDLIAGWA